MITTISDARMRLENYLGDALDVLGEFPPDTFDCCMTSPPYWGKREYANSGIGLERDYRDFIRNLGAICAEIKRVLKPAGSFWLNIGDSYAGKNLIGIPWRIAEVRGVSAVHPSFDATEGIADHCESCSPWGSNTRRTARSRTSGEYLVGEFIYPVLLKTQRVESPGFPGRFTR